MQKFDEWRKEHYEVIKKFLLYLNKKTEDFILKSEITKINGILVYNINEICLMKASAYSGRDKIRDLYDICFICNNYWNELSEDVKSFIRIAVEYKGLEQFEYIIKDQKDELIDNKKLEDDFLKMYDKLGILSS